MRSRAQARSVGATKGGWPGRQKRPTGRVTLAEPRLRRQGRRRGEVAKAARYVCQVALPGAGVGLQRIPGRARAGPSARLAASAPMLRRAQRSAASARVRRCKQTVRCLLLGCTMRHRSRALVHPPETARSRGSRRPDTFATSGALEQAALMLGAVLGALLLAAPALACPRCALGIEARRDFWSQDFGFNLLVAALPFLVIVATCIYVEARERSQASRGSSLDAAQSSTARHLSQDTRRLGT